MQIDKGKGQREKGLGKAILLDIEPKTSGSKSRQRNDELQASETRYRRLFETAKDGILILDGETGKILDVNPFLVDLLGYSHEEFSGKKLWEIGPFKDTVASKAYFDKLQKEKYVRYENLPLQTKIGRSINVEFVSNVYLVNREKVIQCNIRDITVRKQTEDALRESEERFRITLQSLPDAVSILRTGDTRYLYVNDGFTRITGYSLEEAVGKTPFDLNLPSGSVNEDIFYKCILDKEGEDRMGFRFQKKDGAILDTLISCRPLHYGGDDCTLVVMTDITDFKRIEEEKKRLEIQLAQDQKMESMGTFAGGIAHDFNNILAIIMGYAELAGIVSDPDKIHQYIEGVLNASKRAKSLVSQILSFSRYDEKIYAPLILSYAVRESLNLLRSIIPASIEISMNLQSSAMVKADPTEIHQIMMNLCSNATYAMSETGGVLGVNLENVQVDEVAASLNPVLMPGSYLRLTVSDTGRGMTHEVMERIFEPYFTTKGLRSGTGLGLSVVHGIVKKYNGSIICRSIPGTGTTFEIYLPQVESKEDAVITPEEDMVIPTGSEKILFIDDEPALVDIVKKTLVNLGYKVTSTTSSRKALELFKKIPDKFDLVITDMTMPDMTGDKLAQRIMEVRHGMPVILCTGYSENITEQKAKGIGIRGFIMKPFEMRVLAKTIRKVLDER